ncbi:probable calcium-binding protein CML24 [Lolium perenne]|uniref:probable calcium-binding protein CML24 n=1 Tax=Lolium perenne TaxID=4522 RepID=UPI003A9A0955
MSLFQLCNNSLNTVCLRCMFDLFGDTNNGEIRVDKQARALDSLDLIAGHAGLTTIGGMYVPRDMPCHWFNDLEFLHRDLGDTLFGVLDDMPKDGEAASGDGMRRR